VSQLRKYSTFDLCNFVAYVSHGQAEASYVGKGVKCIRRSG